MKLQADRAAGDYFKSRWPHLHGRDWKWRWNVSFKWMSTGVILTCPSAGVSLAEDGLQEKRQKTKNNNAYLHIKVRASAWRPRHRTETQQLHHHSLAQPEVKLWQRELNEVWSWEPPCMISKAAAGPWPNSQLAQEPLGVGDRWIVVRGGGERADFAVIHNRAVNHSSPLQGSVSMSWTPNNHQSQWWSFCLFLSS